MALSFVASSTWTVSVNTVTPSAPTGVAVGDLVVMTLVSKYDDATVATPPSGWTDQGAVSNTGRPTGVDNGNLRMRVWTRVWQSGDTMPTLDPTPNNVSVGHATAYRVAAGKVFNVQSSVTADDTTGSPSAHTSSLALTVGDILHIDHCLNGDAPTYGTVTLTATGATMSAVSTNTADSSTTSGTDLRYRSVRYTVNSGSASSVTYSVTLGGTTTNAVSTATMMRIREADPLNIGAGQTTETDAAQAVGRSKGVALGQAW